MDSIINWFLVWWLRSGRYNWSKMRRWLFERCYLKKELPKANSLGEIEECLKDVKWTKDGPWHLFDCISYPQVTWDKKKDDCDGFASLAAELLRRWNPDCSPVLITALVRPVGNSHTVCAFTTTTGSISVFDNDSLHTENYQTHSEVLPRIIKGDTKLVCWDIRNPTTLEMIEFHRM